MKPSRLRLGIASILFVSWIGWLAYLALTASRPIVLSRPQFLVSEFDVIAELEGEPDRPNANAQVVSIAWSLDKTAAPASGTKIHVGNLPAVTNKHGWQGPGVYILPLVRTESGFHIAPIPRSPGFNHRDDEPRIYLRTPESLAQLRSIRADEP